MLKHFLTNLTNSQSGHRIGNNDSRDLHMTDTLKSKKNRYANQCCHVVKNVHRFMNFKNDL